MTREESKVKTFDILRFVADNAGLTTFEAIEKAYNMGVSEQEPILDKIRADITALKSHHINDCYDDGFQGCRANVLQIFDKYKGESEK